MEMAGKNDKKLKSGLLFQDNGHDVPFAHEKQLRLEIIKLAEWIAGWAI